MSAERESGEVEAVALAIRLALKHWMLNVTPEEAKFAGQAAIAALRAHELENKQDEAKS